MNERTAPGYGDAWPEEHEETISADIAQRLISGETVKGITGDHSFNDVLQHLWDNVDDSNAFEAALLSIADGAENLPAIVIRKLINRATEEYAQKIESDVISAIAEDNRISRE